MSDDGLNFDLYVFWLSCNRIEKLLHLDACAVELIEKCQHDIHAVVVNVYILRQLTEQL